MERFDSGCRYFRSDRPCAHHKATAGPCFPCDVSSPRGTRILVIKTGSSGDVLRTTSILKGLKKMYPRGYITWVVEEKCADVIRENPYIDRLLLYGTPALSYLQVTSFDLAVNLDVSVESSALMAMAKASTKRGFSLDEAGNVYPVNLESVKWYGMSLRDDLKKMNMETYTDIIHDIAGIPRDGERPVLALPDEYSKNAAKFAEEKGLAGVRPLVGVNIGSGDRWQKKSPEADKWVEIIRVLADEIKAGFILLGGSSPEDRRKHDEIVSACGQYTVDGMEGVSDFLSFCSVIGLCDVLVTSDTLALHVGTALGKKIAALFGPTSASEIDLYGCGIKVVSQMDCLCCYLETCGKSPDCMSGLDPYAVSKAVKDLLYG